MDTQNNRGEFIFERAEFLNAFAPLHYLEVEDLWSMTIAFDAESKKMKIIYKDNAEVSINALLRPKEVKKMPDCPPEDRVVFSIELPADEKNHVNFSSLRMLKLLLKLQFKAVKISFNKEDHAGKIVRYYMGIDSDTGYNLAIKTLPVL